MYPFVWYIKAISVLILIERPLELPETLLNFTAVKIKGQLGCVPVKGGCTPVVFLPRSLDLSGVLREAGLPLIGIEGRDS